MNEKFQTAFTWCQLFLKDDRKLTLLLGLIGWILILGHYPFEWDIPEYAAY